MLTNYFKIAIRILARNKAYSFINIAGLAVGLAACILILLYIRFELSYDRYNKNANRIYRVTQHIQTPDHQSDFATSPAPLASLLKTNSSDVKKVARMVQMSHHISTYTDVLVSYQSNHFYEKNLYYVDPSAFEIFTWPVLKGNVKTGLTRPYTIFISSSMAHKYFGEQNPMGKSIQIGGSQDYEITGVFKDFPSNSHIHPDFLASFSTIDPSSAKNMWVYIYLLLKDKSDLPQVTKQLSKIAKSDIPSSQDERSTFSLIPLTDIHLHSDLRLEAEPQGDIQYVYLFGAIALLILAIACFNYVNMAIAQSSKRGLETGIRKVAGATRKQLIGQYFFESFLLNLFALILALCIVEWTLPYFNHLTQLNLSLWSIDPLWWIAISCGVLVIISFLSGSYPALLLSSFRPVLILKGKTTLRSGIQLRKGLVIFQFIISIVLIICAIIIQMQMNYIQKEKPSVKNSSILLIKNRRSLFKEYHAFKSELLKNSKIHSVTTTQFVPGTIKGTTNFGTNDVEGYHQKLSDVPLFYGDKDFIKTLGLDIIKGRNFSKKYPTDETKSILVNEKAVKTFGWKDPIGKYIWFKTGHLSNGKLVFSREKKYVIGVVKSFHYESLRKEVEPAIIELSDHGGMVNIAVQISNDNIPKTLSFIKKKWNEFVPDKPLDYSFLQDDYSKMYGKDHLLNRLFKNFALLAIIISCLGLFGLSAFTAKQRTKEIGIRKVLGASTSQIIMLLSKNFLLLIAIAIIIAIPVAWLAMDLWLQNFAYQVAIHWWVFFLAGILAIFIAWLTVGFQTIRVAKANPVEALKYE